MAKTREIETFLSPLRYPGGKAFLAPYVARTLEHNGIRPDVFVEPFAGGASVSLQMVTQDLVDSIALYDLDPMVSGFWWTVFNRHKYLVEKVKEEVVSVEKWRELKEQKINGHCTNGWKCLFLNRTSFSGILNESSGPIGGHSQASDYKVDCRYYGDTILRRLKSLWDIRDRVFDVGSQSYECTLRYYEKRRTLAPFYYLDPPFFYKADKLYNFYFGQDDHDAFVTRVANLSSPWLLSYDYCPETVALMRRHGLSYKILPVTYNAAANSKSQKRELVSSNLELPRMKT